MPLPCLVLSCLVFASSDAVWSPIAISSLSSMLLLVLARLTGPPSDLGASLPACWLVFSFVAHYPATPAPWYETRFPDVTIPITPNYNISSPNKTQHIRQNPPLTDGAPPQPRSQPDSCLAFQTSALCQASLHFSPCKGDRFEMLNIRYKYIIHYVTVYASMQCTLCSCEMLGGSAFPRSLAYSIVC